ncbi:Type 1 glutamine amidotransferase-like domain-containing protein [Candidatus Pacearchaeota archaeon]|nr:Type 1 glutamine amidotransferase-like domain-containing protein [Candidatus Pacearchaeota archaeon]
MTKKILIVGGGEIGRPLEPEKGKGNYPIETLEIDREIIKLSGKANPKLVFLPTASGDSEGYVQVVKNYFGERLGCLVEPIYLIPKEGIVLPSISDIKEKIMGADIVYVGGGNTLKMITRWKEMGIDKILKEAHEKGIVLSGISAGGICWFKYGQSDSLKTLEDPLKLTIVEGLNLIPALHAPHFTREEYRHKSLQELTKTIPEVAIALEDCCALEIVDKGYRVIKSKSGAKAYKCYWKEGKYCKEIIPESLEFNNLEEILKS